VIKHQKSLTLVPQGAYKAKLVKVNRSFNAYGERINFEFYLYGENVEGVLLTRSTNPLLTAKSKLAEVLNGLLGRDLTEYEVNEGVDIEQMIGTVCNVLVLNNKSKTGTTYSNVERIFQ
jgi:hypothetical protein